MRTALIVLTAYTFWASAAAAQPTCGENEELLCLPKTESRRTCWPEKVCDSKGENCKTVESCETKYKSDDSSCSCVRKKS